MFYIPVPFIRILANFVTKQKITVGNREKWIPDLGSAGPDILNIAMPLKKIWKITFSAQKSKIKGN